MMQVKEISYAGPETGYRFVTLFETLDGLRFTAGQWRIMQFMEELGERLDGLEKLVRHICPDKSDDI